jgi:DNA-binding transcriptional MerR regulator
MLTKTMIRSQMVNQLNIPNKSFFKLEEVANLVGVKPYVLRFWATEFHQLSPSQSSTGQKLFSYEDVVKIHEIKRILFQEKLTIEQAKHRMEQVQEPIQLDTIHLDKKDWEKIDLSKKLLRKIIEQTNTAL